MKPAVLFAALAFAILPGIAVASCKGDKMGDTAASCVPGTSWDSESGTCVVNPTT